MIIKKANASDPRVQYSSHKLTPLLLHWNPMLGRLMPSLVLTVI